MKIFPHTLLCIAESMCAQERTRDAKSISTHIWEVLLTFRPIFIHRDSSEDRWPYGDSLNIFIEHIRVQYNIYGEFLFVYLPFEETCIDLCIKVTQWVPNPLTTNISNRTARNSLHQVILRITTFMDLIKTNKFNDPRCIHANAWSLLFAHPCKWHESLSRLRDSLNISSDSAPEFMYLENQKKCFVFTIQSNDQIPFLLIIGSCLMIICVFLVNSSDY
jgi:hypothetical protein